jgi:hypothetical protein
MEFPVDFNVKTKIAECRIVKIDITLFTKVDIMVMFFTEDGRPNQTQHLVMDSSNGYDEWGSNDSYLVEWVKQNIKPPQ